MIFFALLSLAQSLTEMEYDQRSTTLDPYPDSLKVPDPTFQTTLKKDEKILSREAELKCWTCYTVDTLKVNTELCNKTLCTGGARSTCYKWFVEYGFKKYRTYRGCMDNYTEVDYPNAMCKGTGLPLNETCEWSQCNDKDFCNTGLTQSLSLILLVLIGVFWRAYF